jgi:phosphoglycerate kinase
LLENLRFYKKEEKNDDPDFARALAGYGDAFVNDAFGTCHRAHASVSGVPALFSPELVGIGLLVEKELANLDFTGPPPPTPSDDLRLSHSKRVCAAVIGGAKVSTKLPVIKGLLRSVDRIVLAGGLAFTFLKARGVPVGSSLVEEDMVGTAAELLDEAAREHKEIVLPVDHVCARAFPSGPVPESDVKTFDTAPGGAGIEDGWMGLDAGPRSLALYAQVLGDARKIVVNGPLGVFEHPPFDQGTRALFDLLKGFTEAGASTVVGGGDTVAALELFGAASSVSYVSTGGGATLELLAGDVLPGVAAVPDYVDE